MSDSTGQDRGPEAPRTSSGYHAVRGERSTVAFHRLRSIESRIGNILALGLVCALGFALLAWYYHAALERPAGRERGAAAMAMSHAETEMPLPSLGPVTPPRLRASAAPLGSAVPAEPSRSVAQALPNSPIDPASLMPVLAPAPREIQGGEAPGSNGTRPLSAAQRALQRRLSGPVFSSSSGLLDTSVSSGSGEEPSPAGARSFSPASAGDETRASDAGGDDLERLLTPALTPAAVARVLPSRSLVLPQGSFIDCTLETAIDSTLPGMTTCVTATDTFGADGKVVLLERGSQLVGETRGVVEEGAARVFVLWTEARTPTGVVIPLASPGTDELGRSGLQGRVDRHFWQRFGAAMLISIINAGATVAAQSGGGAIIYDPTESQDVASEVLQQTLRIAPQVIKNQGDRIEVLVARDLDFRSVYELRSVAGGR
jgi:type IV secretion system protein VirB10